MMDSSELATIISYPRKTSGIIIYYFIKKRNHQEMLLVVADFILKKPRRRFDGFFFSCTVYWNEIAKYDVIIYEMFLLSCSQLKCVT